MDCTDVRAGNTEVLKFRYNRVGSVDQISGAVVETVTVTNTSVVDQQTFHTAGAKPLCEP